ncbi:hypothetical protein FKW77_003411 [Venturia effusa]|uniref:Uncharacterized protein n=1 Tax=Venturia effusa TaxID=50376 RepID=A0A517L569_9PEZI|nr:hypothetical protein FKW77_003411 [Venturia effusa]
MSPKTKSPTARKTARDSAKNEARLKERDIHIAHLRESRDKSISLRMTKDDLKKLENVNRFGKTSMIGLLADLHHQVAAVEVKQFLEWNKTAEAIEIPIASDEEHSVIKAPSYSIDVLMRQGFSRSNAKMIQRKIEEQRDDQGPETATLAPTAASQEEIANCAKTTKRMRKLQVKDRIAHSLNDRAAATQTKTSQKDDESSQEGSKINTARKKHIEEAIRQGWRPEHVSTLNTLKNYNKLLSDSIAEWEQEELLREYLTEFTKDPESGLCKKKFDKMSSIYRSDAEDITSDFDNITAWFDKREMDMHNADDPIALIDEIVKTEEPAESLIGKWPEERFRYINKRNKYAKIDAGIQSKSETEASKAARVKYDDWYEMSYDKLVDKEAMDEFPAPPIEFCTQCRKNRNLLGFCEHALRNWYTSSDDMEETLRSELRRWHPDRFQKCAPSVRVDMVLKATEMFQLIGKLAKV